METIESLKQEVNDLTRQLAEAKGKIGELEGDAALMKTFKLYEEAQSIINKIDSSTAIDRRDLLGSVRRLYSITKTINSRLKEEKARAESYREGWKLVFDRAETAEADNIKIREELNEETKKKHLLMADNERLWGRVQLIEDTLHENGIYL